MIRRLIFSSPKWSSSRMRRAAAMSIGGFRHPLQAPELLARLVVDLLRHMRAGDCLLELGDFSRPSLVGFAELALDRRHLLAQQDLAVAGVERRLGFPADLLRQPQHLDPMGEQPRNPLHAGGDIHSLEDVLLLVGGSVHEGRDHVGERAGGIDVLDGREQFRRRLRQELNGFDRLAPEMDEPGLDFVGRRSGLGNPLGPGDEERPPGQIVESPETLFALADEMVGAVGRSDVANDIGDRSHSVEVDGNRIFDSGVALHDEADRSLLLHRPLRRENRARTVQRHRQHNPGEQDHAAHRHDDQSVSRQWRRWRPAEVLPPCRGGCLSHSRPPTSAA